MRRTPTVLGLLVIAGCNPDSGLTKYNKDPVATITSHADGDAVDEHTPFTLRGTVSDDNDDVSTLTATWLAGARTLCDAAPVDEDGTTTCEATLELGDDVVTLQGQDPSNAIGLDEVTLSVRETAAPTATITTPTGDGRYYADQDIDVAALVADGEDAPEDLVVAWTDENGDAVDLDTTPGNDGSLSGSLRLDAGEHTLRLDVTDSSGKAGSASVEFTVGAENSGPTCAITAPADGATVELGGTLVLEGEVTDPDVASDLLTAEWSSDVDGALGGGPVDADGTTTLSTGLSFGTHVITLTGTDDAGATCTDTVAINVGTGPEITITAPVDGDLYDEGDDITFVATLADDATSPDLLDVEWSDDLDGVLDTTSADASGLATFDTDALSWGDHTVTLTVTDADGLASSAVVTFTVNGLPTAPDISITPSSPSTDDDLVVSVDTASVDPEGDAVTYAYAWTVDGAATAYTTDTVPASATGHGEVWEVTVTPNDGSGDGASATASVVVGNGAPSVASATLSPDPVYEGDVLTCTLGTTSDPDGDAVTTDIAWEVNGVLVSATTATLGDTWWERGDTVSCTVTPNDGFVDGTPVTSNVVTVDDSTPSITAATITPDPAYAADTLTCATVGYTDADGDADASTFEWLVNGTSVGTGATLAGAFAAGDIVTCNATPSDGTYSGTPASAAITVENSLPVLASASIDPASPTEADTLTCVPGTTTDADGTTSFTYTYAWTVDGATVAETGATLASGEFVHGDTVRCSVTPNDGLDDGAAVASSAVTIQDTAPVVSSVTLSPSAPTVEDTLTVSISASDAEGDAITYSYAWYVDGTLLPVTTSTLDGSFFARGDEVYVSVVASDGSQSSAAADSAVVTVANSAPSLASASVTPASPTVASTLTCAATGFSDADGDADLSTYAWTIDGATVGTGTTLSSGFAAGDTVVCTVTPNDGTDTGTPVTASVTVQDTAPVLASVSLTPTTAYEASTFTCTPGATTDADGTTSFSYTYAWYVNGALVPPTTTTLTGTWFDAGDDVSCLVTPNDGTASGTAVASSTVTVSNTAPVASAVTLTPTSPTIASTLTCAATGTDADGDTVSFTYAWYVDGSAVAATGTTLTSTYFSAGDEVSCAATPSDGTTSGTAVSSSAVTIGNTAPVLSAVSLTPTTAYESSTLTCSPTASDADGDTVSYTYAWYVDGSLIAATSSTLTGTYFGSGDTVYCRVTPSDGTTSGTAMSSSTVTISNTAPVISSVSLTPTAAYEASTLTCSPTATDADGDTISYTYAWYVNGSAVAATSSTLTGTYFSAGNTVYCRATPTDGTTAGTAVSSSTVTISDTVPVLSAVSLTPTTAYEASTLTCSPTATDADGDTISYTYTWYVNGSAVAATSSTLTGTYFSSGNTVYCRVTPSDASGSGTAMSSSTVTISNTAPVLSSVALTPTAAYEASTLTCSPTASDADGDTVSYTYAWYVNGSAVAATSSTLTGTYFSSGSTVYCRVTPTDGSTSGTAVSSSTVTISNTAPVVSSVALTPTTAYEASTLTCTPTATDADGTTLTYTYNWYVNGALVAPTTSTLTGTYFSKGNTVYCSVTASDGTASSSAATSGTVTISNTAPVVSAVSLSPTLVYEASTVTCSPTSSDADGDSVSYTYAWYVNSSLVAATSSTLTGTYFSKGNTVYCRVTPSDGSTSGTAVSSSTVTVGNTAPTAPTVYIDPEDPEAGLDAIVCHLDTASTDADGDSITYSFTWTKNGSAYTGDTDTSTTSTVPASATAAGNVFVCTATPSDGTSSGTAGTDSVTVLGPSYYIGNSTQYATGGPGEAAGYLFAEKITVSSAASLYQLGRYVYLANGGAFSMALYTNSAGAPGTLVAYTTSETSVAGRHEIDVVGAPVSLSAGTYWVAWNCTTQNCRTYYSTSAADGANTNTIYYKSGYTSFPATWPAGSSSLTNQIYNLYGVVR